MREDESEGGKWGAGFQPSSINYQDYRITTIRLYFPNKCRASVIQAHGCELFVLRGLQRFLPRFTSLGLEAECGFPDCASESSANFSPVPSFFPP